MRFPLYEPRREKMYLITLALSEDTDHPANPRRVINKLWVLVRSTSLRRFYRVPTIYVLRRNIIKTQFFYLKIFIL